MWNLAQSTTVANSSQRKSVCVCVFKWIAVYVRVASKGSSTFSPGFYCYDYVANRVFYRIPKSNKVLVIVLFVVWAKAHKQTHKRHFTCGFLRGQDIESQAIIRWHYCYAMNGTKKAPANDKKLGTSDCWCISKWSVDMKRDTKPGHIEIEIQTNAIVLE